MNIVYVAIIILQVCVIIYFMRRSRNEKQKTGNSYETSRNLAISIRPEQLDLKIPDSETFVYGVIMDWNTGDNVMTLATYINGAANLYMSSGSGVRGGGKNPNVGEAAAKFVATAQEFIGSAMPTRLDEVPDKDCVRFYLLTNKRLYAAQEQVKNFGNNTSAWLPLFRMGNEVITEMMN